MLSRSSGEPEWPCRIDQVFRKERPRPGQPALPLDISQRHHWLDLHSGLVRPLSSSLQLGGYGRGFYGW